MHTPLFEGFFFVFGHATPLRQHLPLFSRGLFLFSATLRPYDDTYPSFRGVLFGSANLTLRQRIPLFSRVFFFLVFGHAMPLP